MKVNVQEKHKFGEKRVRVSINAPFLIFLVVSHMIDDPQEKFQKSLQYDLKSFKNWGNIIFHMFFTLSKSFKNEGLKRDKCTNS